MNKFLGSSSIIILILIAVIVFGANTYVPFVGTPKDAGTLTSLQQDTEDEVPTQETESPTLEPEPIGTTIYYEPEPLPTDEPFPTAPPTPVVTRVPVTAWPAISDGNGEKKSFSIYSVRDEAIHIASVSAVDGSRTQDSSPNLHDATGLYLADAVNIWWGDVSPNGQQIALVMSSHELYTSARELDSPIVSSIYLYDVATKSVERLVDNGASPRWSNDSSQIAYYNVATRSLGIINVSEKSAMDIFPVPTSSDSDMDLEHGLDAFAWSPDDKYIAMLQTFSGFANSGAIWVVDSATGRENRQLVGMDMYAGLLRWSPTSSLILFPTTQGTVPEVNLRLVDAQSGEMRQLTSGLGVVNGAWSPDGSSILVSGRSLYEGELESYDIWLLTMETGAVRRLTDDPTVNSINVAWTPDGAGAIFNRFTKEDHTDLGLWELDLTSGELHQVLEGNPGIWMVR